MRIEGEAFRFESAAARRAFGETASRWRDSQGPPKEPSRLRGVKASRGGAALRLPVGRSAHQRSGWMARRIAVDARRHVLRDALAAGGGDRHPAAYPLARSATDNAMVRVMASGSVDGLGATRRIVGAGEDRADGPVSDVCGGGDLAVGETEPRGSKDLLLVFGLGFALALSGAGSRSAGASGPSSSRARCCPARSASAIAASPTPLAIAALAASATRR